MKPVNQSFLVIDLPVIHQGYIRLFRSLVEQVRAVYILGDYFVRSLTLYSPEIRRLDPKDAARLVRSLALFPHVIVLGKSHLSTVRKGRVITTQDCLSRRFVERYLSGVEVTFQSAFLRWDEAAVDSHSIVEVDRTSSSKFDQKILASAIDKAKYSSDWWRQVGAIAVRKKKVILHAYNLHLPHDYSNYLLGDIRDFIPAGKKSEISSAIHAEHELIAQAASRGIPLKDADLYVTTFPCSTCAKLLTRVGFKRVFFMKGNASFDGQAILAAAGIEIIKVIPKSGEKNGK